MVPLCGSSHHFTDFFDIRLLKTLIQSLKKKERKKENEQNDGSLGQRYGVCATHTRSVWSQHHLQRRGLQPQPFPRCHDGGGGAAGLPENHATRKQLCLFVCLSCVMTQIRRSQVTCGHLTNISPTSHQPLQLQFHHGYTSSHGPRSQSFIS